MVDPFARAQAGRLGRGLAALVLGPLVTGALLGLSGTVAALAPVEGPSRVAVFFGAFLAGLACFAAGAIGYAARRARVLDEPFARLGLARGDALLHAREFHGTVHGRPVDAFFSRRGPVFELSVAARSQGALAVGTRTAVGAAARGILGMGEVALADPAFAPYIVGAADPAWAAAMLAQPALRDVALRALHDPAGAEVRTFAVRPGAVRLARMYADPEALARELPSELDLMLRAAQAVEALPPPSVPVALGAFERAARERPVALGRRLALGVVAIVVALVCVGTLAVIALTPSLSTPAGGATGVPHRRGRR